MTDKLKVRLLQIDLIWEDVAGNLNKIEDTIKAFESNADIIVLPEMFTTGFSMSPATIAEEWPGKTLVWMKKLSNDIHSVLCGSIMVKDMNAFLNRFVWVEPSGQVHIYDKRHLFRMGGEHEVYAPGTDRVVINYKGWKIVPFICYDLRFPVWSRNDNQYDLAIYVANWPATRYKVWEKLLMARAIENQCYVIGVNRIGTDGRKLKYSGNSQVIDPRGEPIIKAIPGVPDVVTIDVSLSDLNEFREKFPVALDADNFNINQ